jgi:hypothetical protein
MQEGELITYLILPAPLAAGATSHAFVDGPYNKDLTSKPRVREEYTTSFMNIFHTNKVPRVVLQFLWTCTHLEGKGTNVPHELGTAAPPGTAGPTCAAAPAPCHVLGPNHFLPRVHNLDEQD